jgi:hypothetical protein
MLFPSAVAIAIVVLAPLVQTVQTSNPRTQPESAVKEGIRLLEASKYAEFLKTFARPSEVEEMVAKRPMDELAAEFGEKRAPDLLAALRAAATMKPTISAEGTRAEYSFEKPFGRERRISMVKIGEFWYFR